MSVKLRCLSMSFEQIAEQLTRAIHGREVVPGVDPIGVGPWLIIPIIVGFSTGSRY
jgi:hypothetical protein